MYAHVKNCTSLAAFDLVKKVRERPQPDRRLPELESCGRNECVLDSYRLIGEIGKRRVDGSVLLMNDSHSTPLDAWIKRSTAHTKNQRIDEPFNLIFTMRRGQRDAQASRTIWNCRRADGGDEEAGLFELLG